MNNKDIDRTKCLQKSRQEFSEFTKSEVNKWKRIKQIKDNKRIEELQNKQIDKINKQLIDLRKEYRRATLERGSAHKWAQIVAKQEAEDNELTTRRNSEVLNRSKHILNHFITENSVKQNNLKIEKQNQLLRRKQLMKSSLYSEYDDKEVVDILRQLNGLKNAENLLQKVIKNKSELSHSETSMEKMAEKIFWPKKLVTNQQFLDTIASSNDSNVSNQNSNTFESVVPKVKPKPLPSKQTDVKKLDPISEESGDIWPMNIATKLYHKLRVHQNVRQSVENNQKSVEKKVYRNVAVSTTPERCRPQLQEVNNDSDNLEIDSINSSHPTVYLSFPSAPNLATNKATQALSELLKNFNNPDNKSPVPTIDSLSFQELTVADNETDSMDPLMKRINNLKELIDRKIGENTSDRPLDLNCGDSEQIIRKSHSSQNFPQKYTEEKTDTPATTPNQNSNDSIDTNKSFNDFDANSLSSSLTFKTLHGLSSSGRSSSSISSSLQLLEDIHKDLPSIKSYVDSFDSIKSINSSFVNSKPIRDRNIFWKEVFERAGINVDVNRINDFFPDDKQQSEQTIDSFASFSLSSLSGADPSSHSTPKR